MQIMAYYYSVEEQQGYTNSYYLQYFILYHLFNFSQNFAFDTH